MTQDEVEQEHVNWEAGTTVSVPLSLTGELAAYFVPASLGCLRTAIPPKVIHPPVQVGIPWAGAWILCDPSYAQDPDATPLSRAITILEGRPATVARFRVAHARVFSRTEPSRLRTEMTWVGGTSPVVAGLVPPPSSALEALLLDLTAFVGRDDVDVLYRQALAYFQLIHIHPFADGNGRLARCQVAAVHDGTRSGRAVSFLVAGALRTLNEIIVPAFQPVKQGRVGRYVRAWQRLWDFCSACAARVDAEYAKDRQSFVESTQMGAHGARAHNCLIASPRFSLQSLASAAGLSERKTEAAFNRLIDDGSAVPAGSDRYLYASVLRLRSLCRDELSGAPSAFAGEAGP